MSVHKLRFLSALFLISLFLLSSCGYRLGTGGTLATHRTITIPYVDGDWDGDLTAAIIQAVSQSGNFQYRPEGGSLTLQASVVDVTDEDIGFRYDRTHSGRVRKSIIPDETRLIMSVDIRLIDNLTGCTLIGPVRITSDVDFDHDYYTTRGSINVFSLGQVTDVDEARDAAYTPLNKRMAHKIVDYISDY
ncbi:MAG: hypothetical protein H0X51_04030 [Parachlamydiaceae bacterium]|nr:hypothetical protein [Parachlamydiaceae bacterium]